MKTGETRRRQHDDDYDDDYEDEEPMPRKGKGKRGVKRLVKARLAVANTKTVYRFVKC